MHWFYYVLIAVIWVAAVIAAAQILAGTPQEIPRPKDEI